MAFSITKLNHQQSLLIKAIIEINNAREEQGENNFLPEDVFLWNNAGVFNIHDLQKYLLTEKYCELYKDIYKLKPHLNHYENLDTTELSKQIKKLNKIKRGNNNDQKFK